MPQPTTFKIRPNVDCIITKRASPTQRYAELQVTSNFSFLRGASHPEELVATAAALGYAAIAITDVNTLAGIVRAHIAAKEFGVQLVVGSRVSLLMDIADLTSGVELLLYPTSRRGYGTLCRMLTLGKRRVAKGECSLTLDDLLVENRDLLITIVPPIYSRHYQQRSERARIQLQGLIQYLKSNLYDPRLLSLALTYNYTQHADANSRSIIALARAASLALVATNDAYYHIQERRQLQDLVTCVRHGCTISQAGFRLFENGERYLKSVDEMVRLFRDLPGALERTIEIAQMAAGFSLDQLRYEYPNEIVPGGRSASEYLTELTWTGAIERYPGGLPEAVRSLILEELQLISELKYERYFLTCYDIVQFARSRKILCQGRGAAANSVVCFCLGITSVDPTKIEMLFARFVSKERSEPPDIDIDFEHERREEVIQYIYQKYGRERTGLTAAVITYRQRSAIRDVGKALGLSLETVDRLAKAVHRWTRYVLGPAELQECGLTPNDQSVCNTLALTAQLVGFPRHLSQHVGGFVITEHPLCESVPILNAGMESRTIIEWDKDDIEALGMLKIDVLALGMLSCIRKALQYINAENKGPALELHSIPAEDPTVYEMICRSDTVGVFQIESRAQMSMLPRLKPRCFYDLVIEVAIVRPGPIQGNMVHPYLRRRSGVEQVVYPDSRVEEVLGKTLGVPLFQEQAMRLVIVLAGFSPGEAEQLRRAMQAWKRNKGLIATFRERIIAGMTSKGYSVEFADNCVNQIKGFSEYGFPESHAASFALLVYASAWIKCRYPVHFAAALINSQPMGFYAPAQIISDARAHSVEVRALDINASSWDCTLEYSDSEVAALRLGMRLIKGLAQTQAELLVALRANGEFVSILDLWMRSHLRARASGADALSNRPISTSTLLKLARADAFGSLGISTREALWQIRALPAALLPLDPLMITPTDSPVLPQQSQQQLMFQDYATTGLSLKAHPLHFLRPLLTRRLVSTAQQLKESVAATGANKKLQIAVAGAAIVRQRPGTARGVVFITLEDETGIVNLIIRPAVFERFQREVMCGVILLARGVVDCVTPDVIYVSPSTIEVLDQHLAELRRVELPSLSYSY